MVAFIYLFVKLPVMSEATVIMVKPFASFNYTKRDLFICTSFARCFWRLSAPLLNLIKYSCCCPDRQGGGSVRWTLCLLHVLNPKRNVLGFRGNLAKVTTRDSSEWAGFKSQAGFGFFFPEENSCSSGIVGTIISWSINSGWHLSWVFFRWTLRPSWTLMATFQKSWVRTSI